MALFGCSSDGDGGTSGSEASATAPIYAGSTLPAAVNATSAEAIGRAATEGVNEAVNLMSAGTAVPFAPVAVETTNTNPNSNALPQKVYEIATTVLQVSPAEELPTAVLMSFDQLNAQTNSTFFCGGSVDIPDNIDQNAELNFTMTFYNLCYDDGITPLTMDGVLTFSQTDTELTIAFTDFSVNIDGTTESFTGTFTCAADTFDCAIATDFTGSNGTNVFRLENVDISGNEFSGYTLTADFYHDELGMVAITTDLAVTYGSCGTFPDGGMISLAGAGGSSMSVSFNSDCSFTVEGFDGNNAFGPETLSWSAI
jgi:hypothetical protein